MWGEDRLSGGLLPSGGEGRGCFVVKLLLYAPARTLCPVPPLTQTKDTDGDGETGRDGCLAKSSSLPSPAAMLAGSVQAPSNENSSVNPWGLLGPPDSSSECVRACVGLLSVGRPVCLGKSIARALGGVRWFTGRKSS